MPTLESLGLSIDLEAEALRYPGPWPEESGLLVGRHYFFARTKAYRRLGQATVIFEDTATSETANIAGPLPLNYALLMLNAAPMGTRHPVLAVGSNASPSQLGKKFRRAGVSTVVPMFRATVQDLDVAFSGHISTPGYVPAAPRVRRGASSQLFVLWLDGSQLDALDRTEPNYRRVSLPSGNPIALENYESAFGVMLYASRHGILVADSESADTRASSQASVLGWMVDSLCTLEKFRGCDSEAAAHHLAQSDQLREDARNELAAAGWTEPDGLDVSTSDEPPTYDTFLDTLQIDASWPESHIVRPTPQLDRREGRPTAILPPMPLLPEIRRRAIVQHPAGNGPSVVVRVERAPNEGSGVSLDQVVRNAVGVEVGDRVTIRPAAAERRALFDSLLGTQRHIACRVQPADLAVVEQSACLLSQLSLDILGIQSGDQAVIEGIPVESSTVPPVVRLKAVRTDDATLKRREALSGGDLAARFPSARDALGVHPDLPWIFLDNEARSQLGLSGQKLGVVLVHAHRRQQIAKQLRALALLLAVSLIGIVDIAPTTAFRAAMSGAVLLVLVAIVVVELRYRLSSGERRPDRRQRRRAHRWQPPV